MQDGTNSSEKHSLFSHLTRFQSVSDSLSDRCLENWVLVILTVLQTDKITKVQGKLLAPKLSLFLFYIKKVNWRIIVLQCCIGFCQTRMQISHKYTYAPSLLNLTPTPPLTASHPSRSSQSTEGASCVIQQLPTS